MNGSLNMAIKNTPDIESSIRFSDSLLLHRRQWMQRQLIPITHMSRDSKGHSIQIWKYLNVFLGAIWHENGRLEIVSEKRILNGVNPNDSSSAFLSRIAEHPPRRWSLIISHANTIIVLPHMRAAGRPGPDWKPLEVTKNPSQRGHMFDSEKVERGHLADDTPENVALIERAGARRENWQGTDVKGNDIYLFNNPDGIQVWAKARVIKGEGYRIVEGGINLPGKHARFNHHLGQNETFFQGRVARYTNNVASRVFGPWRDGGGLSKFNNPPRKGNQPKSWDVHALKGHVALSSFRQLLQQTNLIDSYNSSHPHNMMPHQGVLSGEIGGVACSSTYISGLFDGLDSLVEEDHFFAVPMLSDGKMPFTNGELKQILRELAIGIYVHSTVPFFSLHFREEGSDLFPVIHPAYQNTLVGRVIGMLDYFMKGYLNGGVYSEEFIDRWHEHAEWSGDETSVLPGLIEFASYCKTHMEGSDKQYESLATLHGLVDDDPTIPEILKSFRGFKNSFRIIAKQNSVQKGGNLFVLDGDFDVLYDIVPSPEYKLALEEYTRKFGCPPSSYLKLQELYKVIAKRIHDHMAKMPLCRQYFDLLNVISFFSGYFSTLKKHRKAPSLTRMEVPLARGCPPLFPHLPISVKKTENFKFNLRKVFICALTSHRDEFTEYFKSFYLHLLDKKRGQFNSPNKPRLIEILKNQFFEHILSSSSTPVKRYLQNNRDQLPLAILADQIHQYLFDSFKEFYENYPGRSINLLSVEVVSHSAVFSFFYEIQKRLPDVEQDVVRVSAPVIYLPKEIEPSIRSKVEKVVGGCGLRLEKHQVTPSLLAETILHRNSQKLFLASGETIQVVPDMLGNQHAVFRLFIEDLPPHIIEDFSWMEDSLLVRPHDSYEMLELRLDIQEAMLSGEKEVFLELIGSAPYLRKLVDKEGRNLLHMAAGFLDPFFVKELLSRGFSFEDRDLGGYTPLHYAAMTGSIAMYDHLLTKANINVAAKNGATPLIVAIQNKQEKVVDLLLRAEARFTLMAGGYSTLHCALHEGDLDIIFFLLRSPDAKKFVNSNSIEGGTPLILATRLNNREIVLHLLDLGADPSYTGRDGMTPLEIAIRNKSIPIVEILLERAALSPSAIHAAAEIGDEG